MKAVSSALSILSLSISGISGFTSPQSSQKPSRIICLSTIESIPTNSILADYSHETSPRLPYSPTGYNTWQWTTHHNPTAQLNNDVASTTHNINYLSLSPTEQGGDDKPSIVLIHGFGASSYHWRHNLPVLARTHRVYALDLLGFGWSDKPIMDYDASVWRDQVLDFVEQIVLRDDDGGNGVILAGNSLGGYTAMYASSDERIQKVVKGCILLNSAGRFRNLEEETPSEPNPIVKYLSSAIQRMVIAASFIYTKQPSRIEQILRNVYPVNNVNVDEELVQSIQMPSLHPNAAEVFYRVIAKNGRGPQACVDDLLEKTSCPILLCWGEKDPWIVSETADRMLQIHNDFHGGIRCIKRVSIDAGHCPHDENPESVNQAILEFCEEVL
jgi:pimeloyl-ACP methyl ester carboxylesterase